MNNPAGVTGKVERWTSIAGREARGGGSAGGHISTGMAEGAKDLSGKEVAMPRAGSTAGTRHETTEEAVHMDTPGAKGAEGPRAIKVRAGGESPEGDGPNPCPARGRSSRREGKGI
jgi:hypothetical protein